MCIRDRIHEVKESDLHVGGHFEALGAEAGYGRPLTLDESLSLLHDPPTEAQMFGDAPAVFIRHTEQDEQAERQEELDDERQEER